MMPEVDRRSFAKWLSVCWLASVLSISGLLWTMFYPDRHPVAFALSISWIVAAVVAALTRAALLKRAPSRFRFAIWEREGRVYRKLGIGVFSRVLKRTPLGWLNPYLKFDSDKLELQRLLREMGYAERAHLIGGAITLAFSVGYGLTGHIQIGACLLMLTMVAHIYPVMLQRWNRGRVLRLIRRQGRKLRCVSLDAGCS